MSKGKVPVKKILSIICTVLTALIVSLAALVIINMIYCRAKNKPVSFFGTSFALVQTDSMEPDIMTGDLIVFRSCSYEDIKVGDFIVFTAGDGFGKLKGQSIVHEAREITPDGIVTKGTNNNSEDIDKVTGANLLGICTYNSAGWGKFFRFISKYGIFIIIAVVAIPFIVQQIIKIVKLSKRKETAAEVDTDNVSAISGEKQANENSSTRSENTNFDDLVK
ncbi:MAG: signal peptidase I [Clostridia bacterium]|nr:signal peptidase I [Clostridia bacterium]